jgi:hypothetical protein
VCESPNSKRRFETSLPGRFEAPKINIPQYNLLPDNKKLHLVFLGRDEDGKRGYNIDFIQHNADTKASADGPGTSQ